MDPYLSRLRYRARFGLLDTPELPGDTRRAYGPDDELVSDTAAVDVRITRADFILISHSHFNHCLDMPHIARKTGATVIGTESTTLLARAGRVPHALERAITALRRAASRADPRGRGVREGGQGGLPANARGHSPPLRATRPAGEAAIGHGGDTSWFYWALWSAAFAALT